jgi:crotonobetainyl-CoA:carnitine CoA-transferase CaiB-like acyl-CoA transferase
LLADLGADVIKVEAPGGDLGRAFFPFIKGESVTFMSLNRNKRGMALDLKNPDHLRIARELVTSADVLVESFRPGVMDRLSLGYEELAAANPRLVYCSVSAYGQAGPWKDKPGVDGVVQAASGLMSVTGAAGAAPCKVQVPVVDVVTGYLATVAVLAALAQRDREGHGQRVEVNLFASAIALQHMAFATYFADGVVPQRLGSAAPYAAPNEALRCADGWIMVAAYHPARWEALCTVLELPGLANDSRFADSSSRVAHRGALIEALEARMCERSKHEWLEKFQAVDIICGPINDYGEVTASPQFLHAAMAETMQHPVAGELKMPRSPFAAAGAAPASRRAAPLLGEHSQEVLSGLGYSVEQINQLLAPRMAAGALQD